MKNNEIQMSDGLRRDKGQSHNLLGKRGTFQQCMGNTNVMNDNEL